MMTQTPAMLSTIFMRAIIFGLMLEPVLLHAWSLGKLIRYHDPFQLMPTSKPSEQEWAWNQIGSLADPKKDFCECQN
jgi:hypothetical protein